MSGPIRPGRTFFMGGYQGFYENIPFPVTRTIHTADQMRGDFSRTTTANGTPILIYDPATTVCNATFSSCTRERQGDSQPRRHLRVTRAQLVRPYPQFTNFSMNRLNLGSAYYNALEAVATRRYSNGVMFAVNYTWMKLEDKINFLTDYDTEPFRDLQGDQRRHRLVITTLIDLPFGPGKPIGGNTQGLVAALIGGWQFNTIGEIQSGRPLALNTSAVQLDRNVALPESEQSFGRWFDNSSTALNNPRPDGTSPGACSVRTTTASSRAASTTSTSQPNPSGRCRCSRATG